MNLFRFYVLSTFFMCGSSLMPTKKICKDCKYFIGDNRECGRFGDTNIITGKVTYPYAKSVREDEQKCGEDAILFEENQFKIITIPYYFLKKNSLYFLPSAVVLSYFWTVHHLIFVTY